MFKYDPKSSKAEEFIHDGEIRETLEWAAANRTNLPLIESVIEKARECKGKPTAIIQKSTKGKGVSFMENQVSWHGSAPNAEQYAEAMAELDAKLKELEA